MGQCRPLPSGLRTPDNGSDLVFQGTSLVSLWGPGGSQPPTYVTAWSCRLSHGRREPLLCFLQLPTGSWLGVALHTDLLQPCLAQEKAWGGSILGVSMGALRWY